MNRIGCIHDEAEALCAIIRNLAGLHIEDAVPVAGHNSYCLGSGVAHVSLSFNCNGSACIPKFFKLPPVSLNLLLFAVFVNRLKHASIG